MILGQPLSDSSNVIALRNALLALSARVPQAYPGPASDGAYGGVNDQMLTALAYIASRLNGIPGSVKTALQGLPVALAIASASGSSAVASVTTAVKVAVGAAAPALTLAVNAYRITLGPGSGGGAGAGGYPAGSIQSYFDGKWHIAIPKPGLSGVFGESAFMIEGAGDNSPTRTEVRSPTRTEVRSPTRTEVRSPTSTSTEVRSPTSTSTDAYTAGNITVTGGAGSGAYTVVNVYPNTRDFGKSKAGKAAVRELIMMSEAARTGQAPPTVRKTATAAPGLSGGGHGGHHGGGHGGGHGGSYGGRWHGGGYYPVPYVVPVCPTVHMPVVGTDGKTYENACWAAVAGAATVRTPGAMSGLSGIGDMADFTCETCSTGPLSGVTHTEQFVTTSPASGPATVEKKPYQAATGTGPVYTKPWFWGVVAGAVVLTGGAYLALRRKKGSR